MSNSRRPRPQPGPSTQFPCGCQFRVKGGVLVYRPCSRSCPVWQYTQVSAAARGRLVAARPGAEQMLAESAGTVPSLAAGHSWRDCRPAILGLAGVPRPREDAVEMAWSLVSDTDRRLLHQFCCLGWEGAEQIAAAERIGTIMGAALGD